VSYGSGAANTKIGGSGGGLSECVRQVALLGRRLRRSEARCKDLRDKMLTAEKVQERQ